MYQAANKIQCVKKGSDVITEEDVAAVLSPLFTTEIYTHKKGVIKVLNEIQALFMSLKSTLSGIVDEERFKKGKQYISEWKQHAVSKYSLSLVDQDVNQSFEHNGIKDILELNKFVSWLHQLNVDDLMLDIDVSSIIDNIKIKISELHEDSYNMKLKVGTNDRKENGSGANQK